jgi:hypothetical protein
MKTKKSLKKWLILSIITVVAVGGFSSLIRAQFGAKSEQTIEEALADLQNSIDIAKELFNETHISSDGSGVPAGEFWASESAHAALQDAIAAAEAVMAGAYLKDYIELGGFKVSISSEYVSEDYIDVSITVDENPGIWAFSTDISFDPDRLTPVSVVEHDSLQGLYNMYPSVTGSFHNSRMFAAFGSSVSHETGLVFTIRFKVTGEINNIIPVAIGHLFVTIYDPDYINQNKMLYVHTSNEVLLRYGIPPSEPLFGSDNVINTFGNRAVLGDVDGDGFIRLADVTTLARYVVHGTSMANLDKFNADVADIDLNGWIGLHDATLLARFIYGQNDFPLAMNLRYRILVDTDGNAAMRMTEAERIIRDLETPLRQELKVNLIRHTPSNATPNLNRKPGCIFQSDSEICGPRTANDHHFCGTNPNGSDCTDNHHRSSSHFLWRERQDHVNTFRFVGYALCSYNSDNSPPHNNVHGTARGYGGKDMIVSLHPGRNDTQKRKTTAHEISHMLGASCYLDANRRSRCTDNEPCVMREADITIFHMWCTKCKNEIILEQRKLYRLRQIYE